MNIYSQDMSASILVNEDRLLVLLEIVLMEAAFSQGEKLVVRDSEWQRGAWVGQGSLGSRTSLTQLLVMLGVLDEAALFV